MVLQVFTSLPRKSLSINGEKHDIAYITPQLIVSSMPTTNYWASWYRTGAAQLKSYLETTHGTNWHIWNLQELSENDYPDEFFDSKVSRHPTPDHTPPPLEQLLKITDEIDEFLGKSENNIALVHCKAGMGRSGTVVCAYLQLHHDMSHDNAISIFTEARMRRFFGQGVKISSQVRYLRYIEKHKKEQLLVAEATGKTSRVKIVAISLRNPIYDDLTVEVESGTTQQHAHLAAHQWNQNTKTFGELSVLQFVPIGPSLYSPVDVVVKFSRTTVIKKVPVLHSMARIFFNAAMEARESQNVQKSPLSPVATHSFSCSWNQLDGLKGTFFRGSALFESLEIGYELLPLDEPYTSTAFTQIDTPAAGESFSPEISAFDADKVPCPEDVVDSLVAPQLSPPE